MYGSHGRRLSTLLISNFTKATYQMEGSVLIPVLAWCSYIERIGSHSVANTPSIPPKYHVCRQPDEK